MKGRKPLPSKIVALRGGRAYTHRPMNAQEPRPPEKMPACPKHLDAIARKEWRRVGRILMTIGLLTELDRAVLAGYCLAWSEWIQATEAAQKTGTVYKRKDGSPALNPYLRVAREAYERWMKAAVLLGLSPSSRASLKVEKPQPASKFAGLIGVQHEQR